MMSVLQESTVQYSTVQYSTVQYNTIQYSTVQYSTVLQDGLDVELCTYALTLVNKTLYEIDDQPTFYDQTDFMEDLGIDRSDMEDVEAAVIIVNSDEVQYPISHQVAFECLLQYPMLFRPQAH